MKANKFFAIALAALTLVGFNSCKKEKADVEVLTLDPVSMTLKVGEYGTITANIPVETWISNDDGVAMISGSGVSGSVKAIAEGTAIITATTKDGQTKTCVVLVSNSGGGGGAGTLKGIHIWPIILDETTATANASKIVADFRPNDVEKHLYVWDGSYIGGSTTGLNFHGNTDGYMSMITNTDNYGGAGFNLGADNEFLAAATALRKAIVANPDKYFLHLAIKSTDSQNVSYYVFGCEGSYFTIGSAATPYSSNVIGNYVRDGQWHEFDIALSAYATALASVVDGKEDNVFCMLAAGPKGSVLNLDAVYFYEVE